MIAIDLPHVLHRSYKSIFVASIESTIQPLEIPFANGGEAFWLDARTIAHAVDEGEAEDKIKALYVFSVEYETGGDVGILSTPENPIFIGKFPTATPTNFKYNPEADTLLFSDFVFADGDLKAVKKHDEEWANRGDSAYVYDNGLERYWDTWAGPKKRSLFTVSLKKRSDGKWTLGSEFPSPLNGTGHVCTACLCPRPNIHPATAPTR